MRYSDVITLLGKESTQVTLVISVPMAMLSVTRVVAWICTALLRVTETVHEIVRVAGSYVPAGTEP